MDRTTLSGFLQINRRGAFAFLALSAILFLLGGVCHAQRETGRITGRVTDPSGAVVPGAQITVTNEETGIKSSAVTDDHGLYVVQFLPPGRYQITASLPGFRTVQRRGLVVTVSEAMNVDIKLELGELSEVVTVTEAAPLLEASTSDIGQLIESKTVAEMPLNGRRAMNLAALVGASVWVSYGGEAKPNFSLAGGRSQSQMFWIDGGGGQNMRLGIGQMDIDPPVEVVREFKILSNNYSAEFGGSAGGLVIMTTKSGTNQLHGSGFEYLRNDALDAANFFATMDPVTGKKEKAPLRFNLFGGTIGGPIVKDRTHFFAAYEGTRKSTGFTDILTVPTLLQRQGDFSQTFDARGNLILIYDPATTRAEGGRVVRDPFPGNRIPPNRIDPVAAKLMAFWPEPNRPPANLAGANNFAGNWSQIFTRDNVTVRVDHVFSQNDKFYFRYIFNRDPLRNTTVYPEAAADTRNNSERFQQNFLFSYLHTFSRNLTNDARYTFVPRNFHSVSDGLGGGWPERIGLKGVSNEAFPRITVAGFAPLGSTTHERRQFPIRQHQFVDSLSYVRGAHILKFGGEVRYSSNFEVNRPSISGNFSFATQPTGLPGRAGTGNGLASLLLGFPNSFTLRETEVLDRYSWYVAWYLQDDWKIGPNLTLNLGLRWETDTPMTDKNKRMNGFDMEAINPVSGTPGVVRFAGRDGWPDGISEADLNNFGPRFGFAWRPLGSQRTVVRGGFGIFYAHPFDRGAPSSAALGFERSASLTTPDNGITAPFFLRDGVPQVRSPGPELLDAGFGAVRVGERTTTAVTFYERSRRIGYAQHFNLSIQRELSGGILFEVAYLGNLSRKLANANLSINQIPPERMGPRATQVDRPFPQFSDVTIVAPSLGVSNYHAAMIKVEKRFAHGLNFLSTYTFSKNIGNADSGGADLGDVPVYSNFYNRRADKGFSGLDIAHRFTWSSVYELPFGKGRRWLSRGPLSRVIGGWTLGAIAVIQSGPPFSLWTQTNTTNAFSAGPQRVNLLRDPNLPRSQRRIERWFDTEAVSLPEPYTFGNSGRGLVRGDGQINFDFSLNKNFDLTEGAFVQLRFETFNAFNHPNFDLPGHVLGGPGFGIVTAASEGRIIQFGLRILF